MKNATIDRDEVEGLLDQIHLARATAKPGAILDEFTILHHADDGKLKMITGLVPRGFFATQPLKKAKKKTNTARRSGHGKKK